MSIMSIRVCCDHGCCTGIPISNLELVGPVPVDGAVLIDTDIVFTWSWDHASHMQCELDLSDTEGTQTIHTWTQVLYGVFVLI